jgi:hypothetical protein
VVVTLKAAFDEIVFASHTLLDILQKLLRIRFSLFAAGLNSHLGDLELKVEAARCQVKGIE